MKKLIAVISSIAMLSFTSLSAFTVSAEEFVADTTTAVYDVQSEIFTTTADPDIEFIPLSFVGDFTDGYQIDFGSPIGDARFIDIYLQNVGDVVSAYGKILFDVTVDDTVYTVRYPWSFEYDESPCLSLNIHDAVDVNVVWNESYMCYLSEMDSDIAEKITEEIRSCTCATLNILYTRDKSEDMPVYTETETESTTTTTTAPPEDIYTYTYTYTQTTTVPVETTTAPHTADTVTETTVSAYLVNDGYIVENCEVTVPVYNIKGTVTVTSTVESDTVAEVVGIEYFEDMANIHIIGLKIGTAEFEVSGENGYSERFIVEVIPDETTVTVTSVSHDYTYTHTTPMFAETTDSPHTTTTPIGTDCDTLFKGDANLDGTVDISDVVTVSAYISDSEKNRINSAAVKCADVHNYGDGLTVNDILMIQKHLSGEIIDL